jgi:hypothetical protein
VPVRPAPLGASGVLVGADHRGVEHLQPLLASTAAGQGREHRLEQAQVTPAREAAPDRVPPTVPVGDRPPARPFARPPQDAVQVAPGRMARPATLRREHRLDQLPFHVRQITPSHTILPLLQRRENRRA